MAGRPACHNWGKRDGRQGIGVVPMETEELYYVYALVSAKDGRIYVGLSHDPEKRVSEHNQGKVTSTKG